MKRIERMTKDEIADFLLTTIKVCGSACPMHDECVEEVHIPCGDLLKEYLNEVIEDDKTPSDGSAKTLNLCSPNDCIECGTECFRSKLRS